MNKRLPLGLLAILLIVLLAGIGVAYGLWSETLTIEGTVNTGDVDVEFANVQKSEYIGVIENNQYMIKHESNFPGKENAANCSYDSEEAGTDNETLKITVEGAYPSWYCVVLFDVKSTGSVPVHVYEPELVEDDGFDNPGWAEATCWLGEVGYQQLHKDDSMSCQVEIHFTNDDLVTEDDQYTFAYTIEARQWNEPRP